MRDGSIEFAGGVSDLIEVVLGLVGSGSLGL